ncbi:hypothetical protein NDR87_11290 [Nocardia sp. CDC159]|uniref:Uncharacterized protein n=1 Tax=Nocardia pulmonis TaxID=2951408 RepID=A0A9X2IYL3_9NOCA|nr:MULTISPECIES: hypothetical protein [Nocardia]MCM6774056.1 hypothetical protein [Nocardia pulmonis]MCM6786943.1 hypothetical protein [Nocardia sp. CDC159]
MRRGVARTVANDYTGVMNGDPYHIMVASIYAFGATDFDAHRALEPMTRGAVVPGKNRGVTRSIRGWPSISRAARYRARRRTPGGALDYALSDTPDPDWGSAAEDAPPSFGSGGRSVR